MSPFIAVPLEHLNWLEAMTAFAAALGCGLLIGLERERSKLRRDYKMFAGFRTFALSALLGTLCFIFGVAIGLVGALIIGGMSIYSLRNRTHDPGITSELAFIMTYFIGALCLWNIPLAASLAVILTILLLAKQSMHGIAKQWVTETELRDGVFLLALLLIALPLTPNQPLWGSVLNPHLILKLLALILVVQSLAHIAKRLLSSRNALLLSSLASGFVSSTATIASLGLEVRSKQANALSQAGAALMSCVSTLVLMLLIVAGTSFAWLKLLLWPSIAALIILTLWGLWLMRHALPENKSITENDTRMFSLKNAFIIAISLSLIQTAIYALSLYLGNAGLLVGTLFASLFEVHAAIAAVVLQGDPYNSQDKSLIYALMIGLATHSLAKCVNAFLTGGWNYAKAFIPAQIIHTLVFFICLWFML